VSVRSGPKELAAYLRALDEDDEAYGEYLQWKRDGPSQSFVDLQRTSPRTGPCRYLAHHHPRRPAL
jgi:hypothetical protein